MDFYQHITVTNREEAVTAIRDFLTTAAPNGPEWDEDASYLNGDHDGELFIRNADETAFLYFQASGSTHIYVSTVGHSAADSGYGDGTGPAASAIVSAYTTGDGQLYFPDLTSQFAGTLHLFADSSRVIICLEHEPSGVHTVCYAGIYTPLCNSADDPNPIAVVSNASGVSDSTTAVDWQYQPRLHNFPNTVIKRAVNDRKAVRFSSGLGGTLSAIPAQDTSIPTNDRAAGNQVFTVAQMVLLGTYGAGEGLSLSGAGGTDGILRASDGLKSGEVVTEGASDYYCFSAGHYPHLTPARLLIGPIGTEIVP